MFFPNFLREITTVQGLSGDERLVAAKIAEAFAPYCEDVRIDAMQNVIARMGTQGPRVMIVAHQDEIGLMATGVDDTGAIRFTRVGGVDPRILPGSRVIVHTAQGDITGAVGAIPPHLLTADMRAQNYKLEDLYVDLALPASRVRELVPPGTQLSLFGPLTELKNGRIAAKTMDDRAGVALMLRCAQMLSRQQIMAQVFFVASAQEEVGSCGAETAAYALDPDIGIAIDVTHGITPGCDPDEVHALDKVVATAGPFIHPRLHRYLMDKAREIRVEVEEAFTGRDTWTDADVLQVARAGVPTVLLEMPLQYMHTTVETASTRMLEEAARLLAACVAGLDAKWEELLCF